MSLLGISGSLREDSFNTLLLKAAQHLVPAGVTLDVWAGLELIPPFNQDHEHDPADAVGNLRQSIRDADGLLIVTPEYNGSLPGQLKNALDWASRPYDDNVLRDKPVAIIGASPSPGGTASAQVHARTILGRIGAHIVQAELQVPRAYSRFDASGHVDDELRSDLTDVLVKLVADSGEAGSSAAAA